MPTHNVKNERIKRQYLVYLKEAKGLGEPSLDAAAEALNRFETYTRRRDFKLFHVEQAIGFKNRLADQVSQKTGDRLSKATVHAALAALKSFFEWLASQPGYKSVRYTDAAYFRSSAKDARVAKARREQTGPTLEQVRHVVAQMPSETEIERRDRALIAFTILTGARDSAIASFKLKHVDLTIDCLHQDARDVRTKFSKTFDTYFFPVAGNFRQIVVEWVTYLRETKLWGNDDPLFPATKVELNAARQFEAVGLEQKHWQGATSIRTIFRSAFAGAGLAYFNPHSFRNTLVRLGQEICQTPEDFMAWCQNIGHQGVLTAFYSYGEVAGRRQAEIMRNLAKPRVALGPDVDQLADALFRKLRNSGAIDAGTPNSGS